MKQLTSILGILVTALLVSMSASSASDLPPCPASGYFHNCFGSYTWDSGEKYIGEWKNDKRDGHGTYIFADGDKYVGEYKDGKRDGQGTYTHASPDPRSAQEGDKYTGEWKNGKRDGQGLYVFADGHVEFCTYNGGQVSNCSGAKFQKVVPVLKQTFNSLDRDDRQVIQHILKEEGLYNSTIDGAWDTNTLIAIAEFAVLRMKTVEFNRRDVAERILLGILQAGIGEEIEPKHNNNDSIANNKDSNEILNAASGTGFYISNQGHIITNHHVINGCKEVKVHAEGRSSTATILAKDKANDLALLKVSNKPPHVFALSNENPYPLQDIIVAGFPFGNAISSSLKFTKGIVSSLTGLGNNYSEIQIDAAIQPGNSGGPILDDFGNVVGVAVAKLDVDKVYEDFGVIPENTNFGIKGTVVKTLLQAHNIPLQAPNTEEISKSKLSKITTKGTLHLSCWMTLAQIKKMQSQKAMFDKFE